MKGNCRIFRKKRVITPHKNLENITLSIRFRSHWFKRYINHQTVKIEFEKGWTPPVEIGIQGKTYKFEERS